MFVRKWTYSAPAAAICSPTHSLPTRYHRQGQHALPVQLSGVRVLSKSCCNGCDEIQNYRIPLLKLTHGGYGSQKISRDSSRERAFVRERQRDPERVLGRGGARRGGRVPAAHSTLNLYISFHWKQRFSGTLLNPPPIL